MKHLITIFLLLSFTAKAQVFKSPADADIKAANKDSMLFIPAQAIGLTDSIPKAVWKTTVAKEKIVSASLMLTKDDGSILIIDSMWRINIRRENDRIAIIFPDSSRTVYNVVDRMINDSTLTIPFKINKRIFDRAVSIKLDIIR